MKILEILYIAWSLITSKNYIVLLSHNDDIGFVYTSGNDDDIMDLLHSGNEYIYKNMTGQKQFR